MSDLSYCNVESNTDITASDCSSDALSLQDTSAHDFHDFSSADQASKHTALPNDGSHPPAVIKKRGRGRPPIYNLSDKRKAQLKEVGVYTFLLRDAMLSAVYAVVMCLCVCLSHSIIISKRLSIGSRK